MCFHQLTNAIRKRIKIHIHKVKYENTYANLQQNEQFLKNLLQKKFDSFYFKILQNYNVVSHFRFHTTGNSITHNLPFFSWLIAQTPNIRGYRLFSFSFFFLFLSGKKNELCYMVMGCSRFELYNKSDLCRVFFSFSPENSR